MKEFIKAMAFSRYLHLFMGLLVFYGISFAVTYTTPFERMLEALKRFCRADYYVRTVLSQKDIKEGEFYHEAYRERLSLLAKGKFDFSKKEQTQAFFNAKGFIYDSWKEKGGNSYLLANVISRGLHEEGGPEKASFEYFILGEKEIVPFPEYQGGRKARAFVSLGEKVVYIHRDSLDFLLQSFFETFWNMEISGPESFEKGILTHSIYRDLKGLCQEMLVRRRYPEKNFAQNYFIREGFRTYLPTMLAMGEQMVVDRELTLPEASRYPRALLAGFARKPNFTMFFQSYRNRGQEPITQKIWGEFSSRMDFGAPERITLEQISRTSQEILDKQEMTLR